MDKKADIAEKHLDEMDEEDEKEDEKGSRAESRHRKRAKAAKLAAATDEKLNMKLAKELEKVTVDNEKLKLESDMRSFLDSQKY